MGNLPPGMELMLIGPGPGLNVLMRLRRNPGETAAMSATINPATTTMTMARRIIALRTVVRFLGPKGDGVGLAGPGDEPSASYLEAGYIAGGALAIPCGASEGSDPSGGNAPTTGEATPGAGMAGRPGRLGSVEFVPGVRGDAMLATGA